MNLQERVHASLNAVRAGRREDWLSLFAEDAVVEDPVGKSPFDPVGLGHRGHVAIGRFWDQVIAQNKSFDYVISQSHVCGSEVASVARFAITTMAGQPWDLDLVIIHRFTEDGRIASIRGFWEFPD
ncbi:nuclear transport factor 2 family protein [Sphingobium sp. EM0848]|uniref:nuclear transport factor 2 family protein n=1 Tax=Sphingobium sp. EM0848 TaxID=2743473 RepID=UPI00159C2C54|nr:nuclear transport factor 2 family protein [Sphingobium sp. EM0848]